MEIPPAMSLHPQYFCLSGWGWSSTIIYPWNMLKQTQTWNVQSLNEMSLSMIEVDSLSASNVHCKLQSSPHCSILFHILCCLSIQYKSSPLDSFASVLLFASHSTLHHNASLQYLSKWVSFTKWQTFDECSFVKKENHIH